MLNHFTYEVPAAHLTTPEGDRELNRFMKAIGLREVRPGEKADWPVRWFSCGNGVCLHLVGRDGVDVGLGHFCVEVAEEVYEGLAETSWCTRNSGSGRIWLEACGLRVEVRAYVD